MTNRDALAAMVADLDDRQAVSVPVRWLRELLVSSAVTEGPDLLTVADVAKHYGRAPSTVRGWLEAGRLPGAFKIEGRDWRVPRDGLAAFDEKQRSDGVSLAVPTVRPRSTKGRRSATRGKLGAHRAVKRQG